MNLQKHIIITKNGWRYSAEMREKTPKLKVNQVSVRLDISIPDAFFDKPKLQANIKIPAEAIPQSVVDAQMADNIENIVRQATGLDISVTVAEQENKTITE